MIGKKIKANIKKTVSVMLGAAMLTVMVPAMPCTPKASAEEAKPTQKFYYNLNYITNYKSFNKNDKILLVLPDAEQTTYNGKQGLVNIPSGSAKLNVYNLIDEYISEEEEEPEIPSLDEVLTETIEKYKSWRNLLTTYEEFEALDDYYKSSMLSAVGESEDTEANALAATVYAWNDIFELPEISSWDELVPGIKMAMKSEFTDYYKYYYSKDPTDEELAEFIMQQMNDDDNNLDGYYGHQMNMEHIQALVDVVERGQGFDNCMQGTIGYTKLDGSTRTEYDGYSTKEGWWYSCNGGGVTYVGPFNIYSYEECDFTEDDVVIVKNANFPEGTPASVTKDDITVCVKVNGTKFNLPSSDFQLANGGALTDGKVTVTIGDVTATTQIVDRAPEYDVTFTDGKGSGNGSYEEGETVHISALDIAGKVFAGWEGLDGITLESGDVNSSKVSFKMPNKNIALTATYTDSYDITLKVGEGGTASVDKKKSVEGGKVQITATADAWKTEKITAYKTGDKNTKVTVTDNEITMPAYNVTIEVTFEDADLEGVKPSFIGGNDGKVKNVDSTMEYSTDGGETWTDVTGKEITGLSAGEVQVRVKATTDTPAGPVKKVTVPEGTEKANGPSAPGLKTTNPSKKGATDGKIVGVDDTMEYSTDGGKTWTAIAEGVTEITDLGAGNYQVRVKGTDTVKPGAAAKVTLKDPEDKPAPTPKPTPKPTEKPGKIDKTANEFALNAGLKVKHNGSSIDVKWGKVKGASIYEIYATYCGKSKLNKQATIKGEAKIKKKLTKIDKKKINKKKNVKLYVVAYKVENGKKTELGKTIIAHVVGKKNTDFSNAKAIKLDKGKFDVAVGKTASIKATTVLVSKNKKQLSDKHTKEFRYASANPDIAKVSQTGVIKGVKKGKATIFVYSRNGYAKKVTVTVK